MFLDEQTNEFIRKAGRFSFKLFFLIAVAYILLLAAVSVLSERLTKYFSKPIQRLSDGVREISSGNFDKKIDDIKTGDELEHLATCFNVMTDELKTYMANLTKETAEREKISAELNVATNIQLSMLPRDFDFNRADFEIYATMHAAKEVGGDFYDFYLLDENHLMITIADVSGKGVPAALFMATSKVILKNFAMTMKNPDDLGAVMTLANRQICEGNDEMMFVTVFMGMLDLKTGRFIYVNGGHNPPVIYHNGKFEYLAVEENCVLGMMDDIDYEQQEIQLSKGDILYLYTDGVTEAMDENNGQYGEERLLTCLNGTECSCNLQKLLERVKADLGEHVGNAAQSDDITMLTVRFDG
jgi:sigma-B regulation protein RsbU (phosphoserine phosphatase)